MLIPWGYRFGHQVAPSWFGLALAPGALTMGNSLAAIPAAKAAGVPSVASVNKPGKAQQFMLAGRQSHLSTNILTLAQFNSP